MGNITGNEAIVDSRTDYLSLCIENTEGAPITLHPIYLDYVAGRLQGGYLQMGLNQKGANDPEFLLWKYDVDPLTYK